MLAAQTLAHLAKSPDFEMSLGDRFQCLSLAVSHAKSHPVSMNGKHESAIAFLSDLEDQLEVVKVQMELAQHLEPHIGEGGEVAEKIAMLQRRLFNITEVNAISLSIRRGFADTALVVSILCRTVRSTVLQVVHPPCIRTS